MGESLGNFIVKKSIGHKIDNKYAGEKAQKAKLAEALAAARMLGYMQKMSQELPSGEGLGAYVTGAKQWGKKLLKQAPQQTSYDDLRAGLVAGKIGTGVAEEQRLTDEDVLRYLKLIPTKWHSESEESTKFGDILSNLSALAGEEDAPQVQSEWGSGQKAFFLKKALQERMLKGKLNE